MLLTKLLFSSSHAFIKTVACRHASFIIRQPAPSAPREVPTPLVFVSANLWDPDSSAGMSVSSSMLAEKGFTCLQVDLSPPSNVNLSSEILAHFESGLKSAIRSAMIPFAPVIIARSAACIIAQTYISSNPATGLFLVSPPASNEGVSKSLLPTKLDEFDFEAKFPIAILAKPEEMEALSKSNRLCKESTVELKEESDLSDQVFLAKLEGWLDELGV